MRSVWVISVADGDEQGRVMTSVKANRAGGTVRYWVTGEAESVRAVLAGAGDAAVPGSRAARLRQYWASFEEAAGWFAGQPAEVLTLEMPSKASADALRAQLREFAAETGRVLTLSGDRSGTTVTFRFDEEKEEKP
jgi:hypothetical protein